MIYVCPLVFNAHASLFVVVTQVRALQAAGYLEGYSTCVEILQYYNNFYFGLFDGGDPTREALEYLEENHRWMASEAEKNWQTSDYWYCSTPVNCPDSFTFCISSCIVPFCMCVRRRRTGRLVTTGTASPWFTP